MWRIKCARNEMSVEEIGSQCIACVISENNENKWKLNKNRRERERKREQGRTQKVKLHYIYRRGRKIQQLK